MPFKTPVEIPLLAQKYQRELDWERKIVGSCVHCHMIGDAFRTYYRDRASPCRSSGSIPCRCPRSIGLTLAVDEVAKVTAVEEASAAQKATFRAGDEIVSLAGQPSCPRPT